MQFCWCELCPYSARYVSVVRPGIPRRDTVLEMRSQSGISLRSEVRNPPGTQCWISQLQTKKNNNQNFSWYCGLNQSQLLKSDSTREKLRVGSCYFRVTPKAQEEALCVTDFKQLVFSQPLMISEVFFGGLCVCEQDGYQPQMHVVGRGSLETKDESGKPDWGKTLVITADQAVCILQRESPTHLLSSDILNDRKAPHKCFCPV